MSAVTVKWAAGSCLAFNLFVVKDVENYFHPRKRRSIMVSVILIKKPTSTFLDNCGIYSNTNDFFSTLHNRGNKKKNKALAQFRHLLLFLYMKILKNRKFLALCIMKKELLIVTSLQEFYFWPYCPALPELYSLQEDLFIKSENQEKIC